jgi:catechol 2,3-dioxygenase-like lactoylglutathione lyase family enzyme
MSRYFGPVRQNGYVVRDIESAMDQWTRTMGVGPFFFIEEVPVQNFRYRGEPSDLRMSIALASSGPLQIELIQQRNDVPSMYRDFLEAGREGFQHVSFWCDDFDAALEKAAGLGLEEGHSGEIGPGGRFAYFDAPDRTGTVIELSEVAGGKGKFFDAVREAAESWDGTNPIRRIGG